MLLQKRHLSCGLKDTYFTPKLYMILPTTRQCKIKISHFLAQLSTYMYFMTIQSSQSVYWQGLRIGQELGFDSDVKMLSPQCPEWLSGPPNLLSDGYLELYPLGYSGHSMKLTVSSFTAALKSVWSYTSAPLHVFTMRCWMNKEDIQLFLWQLMFNSLMNID